MASIPTAFNVKGIGPLPAWNLITTQTLSGGSSIAFTNSGIVNYNQIWFTLNGITSSSDEDIFYIYASTDGGNTYAVYFYYYFTNAILGQSSYSYSTNVQITSAPPSYSFNTSGYVYVANPNITSIKPIITFGYNAVSPGYTQYTQGSSVSSAQFNAFNFTLYTGTFSGGTIIMYGQ